MKQHKYRSYRQYVTTQKKGYKKKRDRVWAREDNIKLLSQLLKGAESGICHGVRTGAEVEWFRKYLGADVIGTELGDSKEGLIVQWDFNRPNPEWIGKFDFVYSNSFDHAYDAAATLCTWIQQLKPGGKLVIEHSKKHENITKLDPFGATPDEVVGLMESVGLMDVTVHDMPCLLSHDRYVVGIIGVKG